MRQRLGGLTRWQPLALDEKHFNEFCGLELELLYSVDGSWNPCAAPSCYKTTTTLAGLAVSRPGYRDEIIAEVRQVAEDVISCRKQH